jgi:predicted regulator of Ras-like GTPase activity (Roadblock/LC7/MglB family)
MDLAMLLETMAAEEELSFALVVGRDGVLVGSATTGSVDVDAIGALASRSLLDLERLGRAAQGGAVKQLRLRCAGCLVLIEPLETSDVLVLGASGEENKDRVLDGLARNRKQIVQVLSDL